MATHSTATASNNKKGATKPIPEGDLKFAIVILKHLLEEGGAEGSKIQWEKVAQEIDSTGKLKPHGASVKWTHFKNRYDLPLEKIKTSQAGDVTGVGKKGRKRKFEGDNERRNPKPAKLAKKIVESDVDDPVPADDTNASIAAQAIMDGLIIATDYASEVEEDK